MNIEKLKHYLKTTPREQLEKEWEEISQLDIEGPTAVEYIDFMKEMYGDDFTDELKE